MNEGMSVEAKKKGKAGAVVFHVPEEPQIIQIG